MTVRIINADVIDGLKSLAGESVHCVVTSPPYWGLRDYGVPGQIGLEPTLAEHIAKLVEVFREVRRVLRKDGTLWLNYGDAYNAYNGGAGPSSKLSKTQSEARPQLETGYGLKEKTFKPKDLLLMPERIAIALQEDGWYIRSRIIWAKPNPMPESVTDRPTKSHEHIWLMSKQPRYFYDADAIMEKAVAKDLGAYDGGPQRNADGSNANAGRNYRGRIAGNKSHKYVDQYENEASEQHRTKAGLMKVADTEWLSRNARDVWTIATVPYQEAHFATFPPELAERCIKAGCPKEGTVLDPFGGSGTTGLVADRLQRNAILIDLNQAYADMARRRVTNDCPLFTEAAE